LQNFLKFNEVVEKIQMVKWHNGLDLKEFYANAKSKGFENNVSKKTLIDCFSNEEKWQVWIAYYEQEAIGSVAAHSFDIKGKKAYRILARTCVLSNKLPYKSLRTRQQILHHQNVVGRLYIPIMLNWVPKNSKVFITTNENAMGSQRMVHRIWAPIMEESGQLEKVDVIQYRGCQQVVWELKKEKYFTFL